MNGKVYLVGAGPGDPGLITVKGYSCLEKADVVVYDRLVNPKLLKYIKEECKLIYVGKSAKVHTKTQDEINQIIYEEAKKGNIVVRLKGGDPYVFGRGGEEGEYLYDKGIDFETVPGITSPIGGLAYSGIPITHRGVATSFHVITGHLKDESDELNWEALGALNGTMVFLMGVGNLKNISENLIKNGKNKDTPVAIINWATTRNQKTVEGTLENIYEIAISANIKPPSLIVIGHVVALREKLSFFENKPLFGENIVITREESSAKNTILKLEELGANVISFPTIKIQGITPNQELDLAINDIKTYSYLVFTSVNGVKVFFDKFFELKGDIRSLGNIKVAAIGPKTAAAIKKYGIIADLIPEEYVAEDLTKELLKVLNKEDRVLIPRAKIARNRIIEDLSKVCFVKDLKIYETVKSKNDFDEIIGSLNKLDSYSLLFTSASTFTNFSEILGKNSKDVIENGKIISIGPITTKAIEKEGYKVYKQAKDYTIDGVIEIITEGGN